MTPEWITAYAEVGSTIGTVGAVIVALFISGGDRQRRRREDEHYQAERVTAWMLPLPPESAYQMDGEERVQLVVQNTSNQLVYNTIASVVNANTEEHVGSNLQYRIYIGRLPPGRSEYDIHHPGGGMHKKFSIELVFDDSAGRTWLRKGKGTLARLSKSTLAHYDISPPVGWRMP
jgi:hypothetical protein